MPNVATLAPGLEPLLAQELQDFSLLELQKAKALPDLAVGREVGAR
jgi:hypothetical protein